jgi:hypothetical protein
LVVASVNCQSNVTRQMARFSPPTQKDGCESFDSMCANSTADRSFSVRSKVQCTLECVHRTGSEQSTCVGVNYRRDKNICEVYNRCPTSYSTDVPGCQYLQVTNCLLNLRCNVVYVVPRCNEKCKR